MRLVDSYADDTATIVLGGRTLPVPCLVEDDEDGMRWLLHLSSDEIYAPLWARASAAGAVGIIVPGDLKIRAMTAERFAEDREERRPNYVVPAGSWSLFDRVPSYEEVFLAPRGSLVVPKKSGRTGFVHGHTHSEFSPLDGLSNIREIVAQAVSDEQPALALTDHGRCSGHPFLQAECEKAGIKPVFGIEAYLQDDRFARTSPENTKEQNYAIRYGYWHLILWAMDEEGLHNIWAMSTESFRDGLYDQKPRMDWATLRRHSKGVMAASGCLRGPLSAHILRDDEEAARANLGKLLDIYGDRFYLEIQPNELAEQEKVNRALVEMARTHGVPLMATVDSHYPVKSDHDAHETWIAIQTNSDVNDEGDLFSVNLDLYMQTEEDVRRGLGYLGPDVVDEAVRNTLDLVSRTNARIGGKPTPPVFSKKGGPDRDAERLLDLCIANWEKVSGKQVDQAEYMERFEYEFDLLRRKEFCGYFLVVSDYCRWAKANGILVGPGRGSGGGSLVAYLCDIVEVDPVEGDLPFERFMTEGRTALPDFDVDFPASKKDVVLGYLVDTWGAERVVQIGTHLRLKSKGIVKDLTRSMMSVLTERDQYALTKAQALQVEGNAYEIQQAREALSHRTAEIRRDLAKVADIVKVAESDKAGLGMAWDDLWAQFGGELQPYREKYPELFSMADRLQGRLKSYGKHAAGVVISMDRDLTGWLPLSAGGDGRMVTQFDMNALESIGLVKFDILTIRTLDTVQWAIDLIRERRGLDVDVYSWAEEYEDPQVWEEVAQARTLGIFQIETHAGTRLCQRMGPRSLPELCDMITLVRPGPMRSGLTETYLKRRAGLEPVGYPDPRMERILGPSQGCMIYQEQIMSACIVLGGYTSDEADEVRKILGKKKVEKIGPAGQEFVSRAVDNGMEREAAQHLWDQMAEFAKYCITGDTEISLAATNHHGDTLNVEVAYRRLHMPLRDPVRGRTRGGEEFSGPCDVCGAEESPCWVRGRCNACYVWLQKFRDPQRGVHALSYYADERIRPARILDVTSQGDQEVWKIVLEGGRSITATADHRHLTDKGYRVVSDLVIGDMLITDGGYEMPSKEDSARRRRWQKGHLAEPKKILEIIYEGVQPTYDVVMEAPHNFVANGIVTHNSFGKAHAYAYAVLAYWTAWLKFHYPIEFFTAALSTIDKDRIPEFIKEIRRNGYTILPPDINSSGKGFKAEPLAIRYGLDAIKGIGEASVDYLIAGQPYADFATFDQYVTKKGTKASAGVQMLLAKVGALDSLVPSRAALVRLLEARKSGEDTRCLYKNDEVLFTDLRVHRGQYETEEEFQQWVRMTVPPDTCTFDWSSEEAPVNPRTGKKLKKKPLPKKCTKACRQYKAPEPMSLIEGEDYDDETIRAVEHELLGVFLSSSPFDRLNPEDRARCYGDAEKLSDGESGRFYTVAAILMGIRRTKTRASGEEMAFMVLDTEVSTIEAVCFPKKWTEIRTGMHDGQLCLVVLEKQEDDRGFIVQEYLPVH